MANTIQHRTYKPERVKRHFADVSAYYDYWARFTELKATTRVLELAHIDENESVLEVGAGTGLVFEKIVRQNTHGFTAGIDLSSEMLVKARKRLNPFRDTRNFSLQQASAYDLPFEKETFDGLISCYMLDLLPEDDFVDILQEFKRVLKPGGRLLLASMTFGRSWYHHFWACMARTFPDLMTDCRPVELEPFVRRADFEIKTAEKISQNTFPSQIIKVKRI